MKQHLWINGKYEESETYVELTSPYSKRGLQKSPSQTAAW